MLCGTNDVKIFLVHGIYGEIGHVTATYIEDDAWIIYYFGVETRRLLSSRNVPPISMVIQELHWLERMLNGFIPLAQASANVELGKPVKRKREEQYISSGGYLDCWGGHGLSGYSMYPFRGLLDYLASCADGGAHQRDKVPVQCRRVAIRGYHVQAREGDSGHIVGMLVVDVSWTILYLVVDTNTWRTFHKVQIASAWVSSLLWDSDTVATELIRAAIYCSTAYDTNAKIDRLWDLRLREQCSHLNLWKSDVTLEASQ